MIKPILTKKQVMEFDEILEEECTCDGCKKVIFRQKRVDIPPSPREDPNTDPTVYETKVKEYCLVNPLDVSYFTIDDTEYCRDCILGALEKMLDSTMIRLKVRKFHASCYYTEIKGEEKNDCD